MNLHLGDCLEVMATLPDKSVDAIVTDPPYNLGFMGKAWDRKHQHEPWAREAFRLLKPGGHLLAFGGTRTYHRLACVIEDAGFEIRDCLVWGYASGFPKSLDVGKTIDKTEGFWRGRAGAVTIAEQPAKGTEYERRDKGEPVTAAAAAWDGWGTALKPAWEPIVMARKPLRGTVAQTVLEYGTGALNIDGTRIAAPEGLTPGGTTKMGGSFGNGQPVTNPNGSPLGRWPANIVLTDPIFDGGVDGVVGGGIAHVNPPGQLSTAEASGYTGGWGDRQPFGYGDSGTYSRFFLIPKEARSGREPLLRGLLEPGITNLETPPGSPGSNSPRAGAGAGRGGLRENVHPTVKPLELMRHLVRLVTPPRGTVLDPFLGSGTTAIACEMEGFAWIGIEKEAEYVEIAKARLNGVQRGLGLDVQAPTRKRNPSSGQATGYNWDESTNENPTHVTHNIKSGIHYGDDPPRPERQVSQEAPSAEVWPDELPA